MKHLKRINVVLCAILMVAMFATAAAENDWSSISDRFAEIPNLEYQGKEYKLRDQLTSVLFMGVDRREHATDANRTAGGGQADFLMLLVIDDGRNVITPIMINRDTMTEITLIDIYGEESGNYTAQICLSHGFGNGREQSCELTVRAVSKLLKNVPIDHYVAMGMDGIAAFNDVIGGVEVTLEDDFTEFDPEMTKGARIKLKGMQAEYFVRGRYGVGNQTNMYRMHRQRIYLESAKEIILSEIRKSANFVNTMFDAVEDTLITDVRRGYLVNLANKIHLYEVKPFTDIAGVSSVGKSGYMEFIPDEDSIIQTLLDSYYQPV